MPGARDSPRAGLHVRASSGRSGIWHGYLMLPFLHLSGGQVIGSRGTAGGRSCYWVSRTSGAWPASPTGCAEDLGLPCGRCSIAAGAQLDPPRIRHLVPHLRNRPARVPIAVAKLNVSIGGAGRRDPDPFSPNAAQPCLFGSAAEWSIAYATRVGVAEATPRSGAHRGTMAMAAAA